MSTEFNSIISQFPTSAALYRFTSGAETTDSSGNSNTLTAIGVPVQGTPKWGSGCVGLGTSQAFSADDGADFQPAGNFSIAGWFRSNKTGATQFIAQSNSRNTNYAGCYIYVSTANVAVVASGANTGTTLHTHWEQYAGAIDVCDGAWHLIVGTYDGAKLHIYVDGAEDGSGVAWTTAAGFAATNYVRIGCQNITGTNLNYMQGLLDEVAFFPSDALSLAQVQSLYAASITDSSNSAIKALASAVYLFNEGAQLTDSSTGGTHTLTAIGTPTTCTVKFGGSVFLGNSSAYSVVDADILKPTGAFTVGGWIKCPGLGTNIDSYIFQSNSVSPSTAGFRLLLNRNTGYAYIYIGKGTGDTEPDINICLGTTDLRDNTWHFVVATWEKPYLKIYVDGVLQNTSSAWNYDIAYNATNYVMVGARNSAGTPAMYHQGQLDDVFLINGTALQKSQIAELYRMQPAAYYRFTSGAETTDSSLQGNTLTAIGVPVQATPRWGTGCVGLGTSQAFSAEDHADFQPAGNFSVSAWVRTTKTGATQYVMQSYSQNTNPAGLLLNITTANTVQLLSGKNTGTTNNVDYDNVVTTGTITDGAWHHVVGTYDGAKLHVYIDGAEDGTGTAWTNAAAFAATNYVRVGCGNASGTNGSYFQGCLDEVAFFPSDALSLAQVQSLYAKSITDSSNSAIKALASAVYLFNEGGQLVDSSTGGTHTLTAIGKPTTCTPKFGGSVFLGNSSAYSVVDADILKPTGAFSVGGWIKNPGYTATDQFIFQSLSINTNYAGFYITVSANTGKLYFVSGKNTGTTNNTDLKTITGTTTITDGNWHFITATWDTANLKVYVDGVSDATAVAWANAPAYAATNYVRVGCGNLAGANSRIFTGQLDDIFLLNGRALSSTDVSNLYGTYPTSASTDLLKKIRRTRLPGSITGV